jgi:thiol-disulfide isomerase/thioredoxin
MKKFYYIAAISFLVAILAAAAIYIYEEPESHTLTKESGKSKQTDQLFLEMGIIRVAPTAVPLDVSLQDLNGRTVKLSEFKGKIVFLNFWASWCQACRDEMPLMEKLYNKLKKMDFAMLAVSLPEPVSVVKDFFAEYKLSFMALLDPEEKARSLFGVTTIPTTFILDKEGRIIGSAAGPRKWDSKGSFALFEHLVKEGISSTSSQTYRLTLKAPPGII